jgi:hypothetical protein
MSTKIRYQQRKLRQLKYLLRRLQPQRSTDLSNHQQQTLAQRFKKLYAQRHRLPLSYKLQQAALTLALSLGLHQAQAQISFAPVVNNPYNLVASGFDLYSADLVDLDGDGDLDFMYGSYGNTGGYNYGAVLYYQQNNGTATLPNFAAAAANPFGIVLSSQAGGAAPQFADLDGDGDLDLMVTYYDYYGYVGGMEYFQNTGTATAPAFAAGVLNPFGITNPNHEFGNVNLHDIDSDGDIDLFTGEMYGYYTASSIRYQPNTGTSTAPAFGPVQANAFLPPSPFPSGAVRANIDFADLDGDGDLDLFINYYEYYGVYQDRVGYFLNTGTATAPSFSAFTNGIYNIVIPTTASNRDLVFGDLDNDGDEDLIIVTGFGGFNYYENLTPTGPAAVLNFDSSNLVVNEAVGTVNIGVNLTNPSANPIDVEVNLLLGGSADNGLDFILSPIILTFPANSSATQSFSIPITDDIIVEGNEQFSLVLANPTNLATLGTKDTLVVDVIDNDFGAPIINFDTSAYRISEGGGSLSIPITITNPSSNTTTVEVSIGSSSTADNSDVNFTSPANLTFGANTSTGLTLTLPIVDDGLVEGTENLVLRLSNVDNGGSVGTVDSTTIEIVDNDSLIAVQPLSDQGRIEVYPNPFSKQLTLAVEQPEGKAMRLVNTMGQVLLERRLANGTLHLETAGLPAGVYWVQLYDPKTGTALWQQRLVHQ